MKVVVIGGTGLIGSKVVRNLKARGHDVLAASPQSGVDTITGEGVAEAVAGADVVLDVANSPSFADDDVTISNGCCRPRSGRCGRGRGRRLWAATWWSNA